MVNPNSGSSSGLVASSDGTLWRVFGARSAIGAGEPWDHIEFALKHEGVDLLTLKRAFQAIGPQGCRDAILRRGSKAGIHTRRAWFLYEWLLGERLDLPDLPSTAGAYIDALDPADYLVGSEPGPASARHRIRNNMPGSPGFCPLARIRPPGPAHPGEAASSAHGDTAETFRRRISTAVDGKNPTMVKRAAAFLLMKDSQSSWAIESETAPRDRLERWGRATVAACHRPLSVDIMVQLQAEALADTRFVRRGLRDDGVFVGSRGKASEPLPDHIGAKPEDVAGLMADIVAAADVMLKNRVPPAAVAAAVAFGMVYVHPFQDGNGRVHRTLIHQTLALSHAVPTDMPVPVTTQILANLDRYRTVLEGHSRAVLPCMSWRPTVDGNVEVLNDTADLYRYFDATPHAGFIYDCLVAAIDHDLPHEIDWLTRYDAAASRITAAIDGLPSRLVQTLVGIILNNGGTMSRGKRQKLVPEMTDREVAFIEEAVADAFDLAVAARSSELSGEGVAAPGKRKPMTAPPLAGVEDDDPQDAPAP